MVANYSGRGQLNRENVFFPISPFAREDLISRDRLGCRPVPHISPLILHTQAESLNLIGQWTCVIQTEDCCIEDE